MSPLRILDRLQRRSNQYWFDIRAGRKNPRLAAALFAICDELRAKAPESFAPSAEGLLRITERMVRVASTGKRPDIEAARFQQSDAIAAAHVLLNGEAT